MIRTAVLLAAGMGTRLGTLGARRPKGFLEVGGAAIVARSLGRLFAHGIDRVVIGTGHLHAHYDALAERLPFVTCVRNERFATTGSMATLAVAGDAVGGDFLLLESDILYDELALHVLLNDPRPNVVLLSGVTDGGDEVWVEADAAGTIHAVSKRRADLASVSGEWVGISKLSLATYRAICAAHADGDYEHAIVAAAATYAIRVRTVEDLAWGEIDDEAQLRRARDVVWPRIVARESARAIRRDVLLTPGPATTTDSVKRAQLVPDLCPREAEFGAVLREVADGCTALVADSRTHAAVLLGGSGTAAVEAMLASAVGDGPLLVVDNGAYGARMAAIADGCGIPCAVFRSDATTALDLAALESALRGGHDGRPFTHLAVVHHETTTGLLNDVAAIGARCRTHGVALLVDGISSYAAIPLDLAAANVTCLAASANKNLQGMAGIALVIGSRALFAGLRPPRGRSFYLNLGEQYRFFEAEGQMRFTPPVQTVMALRQALLEIRLEGVAARYARYGACWATLLDGLAALGLETLVPRALQSRLVTAIREPDQAGYGFAALHDHCRQRGYTIYPGKLADRRSFRVATIGAITPDDIRGFVAALGDYLRAAAMGRKEY